MDASLASQLNPQFTAPKWESLFKASITGDDDIPINKRGSGVKRLILLNFFRAKAEQVAREKVRHDIIYAIEEPETSQHPNNQRMLLRALSDLSIERRCQLPGGVTIEVKVEGREFQKLMFPTDVGMNR
ncbi:hypothetical protein BMS3Abin06_00336 [bacterium BMS3Abin06]|nr:hypothetical protein BMS3Abin06_00336 [bacterium BMS3Abin06]